MDNSKNAMGATKLSTAQQNAVIPKMYTVEPYEHFKIDTITVPAKALLAKAQQSLVEEVKPGTAREFLKSGRNNKGNPGLNLPMKRPGNPWKKNGVSQARQNVIKPTQYTVNKPMQLTVRNVRNRMPATPAMPATATRMFLPDRNSTIEQPVLQVQQNVIKPTMYTVEPSEHFTLRNDRVPATAQKLLVEEVKPGTAREFLKLGRNIGLNLPMKRPGNPWKKNGGSKKRTRRHKKQLKKHCANT